jgi:TatD DNase family protein
MIDTHTHIYLAEFDDDREAMLERAKEVGLRQLFLPNIDLETVDRLHRICDEHPDFCLPMMGLHPTSAGASLQKDLAAVKLNFEKRKYIAVGEIGIDLYWDKTCIKEQKFAFEEQLQWRIEMDLPVVIHTRDAFPEVMECLKNVGLSNLRGVFHSFGGSREELEQILEYDHFFIGINGVITYKKAHFAAYLNVAPLERIVIETDAPYLTPVPFRGRRNEPAYIVYTAQAIAEARGMSIAELWTATGDNARSFFNL